MHTALRPRKRSRYRGWMFQVGRTLAMVIQLALVFVPLAEGREERVLSAHVEGPRSVPHPGHRPDSCPACQLLSTHGIAQERAELPPVTSAAHCVLAQELQHAYGVAVNSANCSRAPPRSL